MLGHAIIFFTDNGYEKALRRILDESDKRIPQKRREWTFAWGHEPVRIAARHGDNGIAKLLLERGAPASEFWPCISIEQRSGGLWEAVHQGHCEVVKTMLEAGALVNINDNPKCPALREAVDLGNADIAMILLDAGADTSDFTTLKLAVVRENRDDVKSRLFDKIPQPTNSADRYKLFGSAVQDGRYDLIKTMLDSGQRPGAYQCRSALKQAGKWGHGDIVALLKPFSKKRKAKRQLVGSSRSRK